MSNSMSNKTKEDAVEAMSSIKEKIEQEDDDQEASQYLTFIMDGEEYGVDILSVQEIRGWEKATLVPNAPNYIKGVINLRGTIVPIIDLRLRFELEPIEYSETTVVIVLKVSSEEGKERIVGIVVDAVSDVYSLREEDLRDAPSTSENINAGFIANLADVKGVMVIILNLELVLKLEVIEESRT